MCWFLKSVRFYQPVRALFSCLVCFLILPLVMDAPRVSTLEAGILKFGPHYCAVSSAGPCNLQPGETKGEEMGVTFRNLVENVP